MTGGEPGGTSSRAFSITSTTTPRGGLIVAVAGEIDLLTQEEFAATLTTATASAPEELVLDLSAVQFCDSAGLRQLIVVTRSCRASGINLSIKPSTTIRPLVNLTGLNPFLPLTTG